MIVRINGGNHLRRYGYPVHGKRFVVNTNTTEVDDLDNEKIGAGKCQIDEIIAAGNAAIFSPDTLQEANRLGYNNCQYRIGGSER